MFEAFARQRAQIAARSEAEIARDAKKRRLKEESRASAALLKQKQKSVRPIKGKGSRRGRPKQFHPTVLGGGMYTAVANQLYFNSSTILDGRSTYQKKQDLTRRRARDQVDADALAGYRKFHVSAEASAGSEGESEQQQQGESGEAQGESAAASASAAGSEGADDDDEVGASAAGREGESVQQEQAEKEAMSSTGGESQNNVLCVCVCV